MRKILIISICVFLLFTLKVNAEQVVGTDNKFSYVVGSDVITAADGGIYISGQGGASPELFGALYTWFLGLGGGQAGAPLTGAVLIKDVFIDNRLYHEQLFEIKGEIFYGQKDVRVRATLISKSGIDLNSIKLHKYWIGEPKPADTVELKDVLGGVTVVSRDSQNRVAECRIDGKITGLRIGDNTLEISANNDFGVNSKKRMIVRVLTGLRVIGDVLVYPQPASASKDKNLTVQYTLSESADVQMNFINSAKEIVLKERILADTEGGTAGRNKLTVPINSNWSNGIYVGALTSGGKLLKTFRVVIQNNR